MRSRRAGGRGVSSKASRVSPLLLLMGAMVFVMLGSFFLLYRFVQQDQSTAEQVVGRLAEKGGLRAFHPVSAERQPEHSINNNLVALASDPESTLHTLEGVRKRLQYWQLPDLASSGLYRQPDSEKYVVFLTDCGGFNNIRMAFEYFFIVAWVTRRTLVMPPPDGWYLIDFGPFVRMSPEPTDNLVTDYSEFFDMEHMRAAVPIISTEEFRQREGKRMLQLPLDVMTADLKSKAGRGKWKNWVKTQDNNRADLAWSPLQNVIYWPSIKAVETKFDNVPKAFIHHRKKVEFTPEILQRPVIQFASCKDNDGHRYLAQVAAVFAFSDEALSRSYKRMLRDHVHFIDTVFDIAARVVHFMGAFKYSSLHVRRNDLQYKEVFMTAQTTLDHIQPLLHPRETLYIATDEKGDDFFAPFTKEHHIFRWHDFFSEKGGNVLTGIEIPRKLEGCIEQVICAMGRTFFGTLESTFTSYIFRLRGYLDAPDKEVYFHTMAYAGPTEIQHNRQVTWSRKPIQGQIYKSEDPSMWEDAVSAHTTWT